MAKTVRDAITLAMKVPNYIGADETPDSAEAQKALDILNAMALGWEADHIHTGWPADTSIEDDFPLEDRHFEGVTYLLAERLAAGRSETLALGNQKIAMKGFARLCADYKAAEVLRMDDGLRMPSQRNYGWR